MLKEVFTRIANKGIQIAVTDRFKDQLIEEGYDPTYGARPLRRAVMRMLEDSLAEQILSGKILPGDTAVIDINRAGKVNVMIGDIANEPSSETEEQIKMLNNIVAL